MGYRLYEHQELAIQMMDANPQMGLFMDLGVGKTNVALFWTLRAYKRGEIQNALVICPASLVKSWEQAIDGMIAFDGITDKDVETMKRIVTISSFQKTYHAQKVKIGTSNGRDVMRRRISLRPEVDRPWGVVFVDESHCIGAHDSVQTKSAITLSRLARHRYIMTATPVHGASGRESFEKLYGQMQFLYQGRMWRNWTEFCGRYVTSWDRFHKPASWQVQACRRLMQNHAMVVRKEDCLDLPGFTQTDIACELQETKIYNDVRKGDYSKYGITVESAGGEYTKLLQIVSGSCKLGDGSIMQLRTAKDEALRTLLEGTDERMLIFCNYRASIDRVEHICRECGRDPLVYDGRSKRETWKDFQDGKGDVLILQYQSGSAGLNLQTCNICVYWEPCFSALLLEQSGGRIYRSGQDRHCSFYYLVTQGSIEQRVWREVKEGRDVSNKTLVDWAHGHEF